jgi:hypothetical protein
MPRCIAHKRNGDQCKKDAIVGTTVCLAHGGGAKQVRQRARERVAEAQAMKVLQRRGVRQVDNPLLELAGMASEILSLKDVLAEKVNNGKANAAEWASFSQWVDRSVKVLTDLARLDLDERLVRVTEAEALLIVDAVMATLRDDLGLEGEPLAVARQGVARRMRASKAALPSPR